MSLVDRDNYVANTETRGTGLPPRKKDMLREKVVMEKRARSRLRKSLYLEVRQVACDFHEGMLCLRGHVPSYYLKQIAQTVVLEMEGVDEINNQLEVITSSDGL